MQEATPFHKYRRVPTVHRIAFLKALATGRRVVHLGFCGTEGYRSKAVRRDLWLHDHLKDVASELVGIDIQSDCVDRAVQEFGLEAYVADVCDKDAVASLRLKPADLLVAGELIEHLERPGEFLKVAHQLVARDGLMVITTPNAYRFMNTILALIRIEAMNPDHVAIYSRYTLINLVTRHGWEPRWFGMYHHPRSGTVAGKIVFGLQRMATLLSPYFAHGLIVVCKRSVQDS